VLLAARLNDPRKNVAMLLRAFAQVRAKLPDVKLVLVGEEPDESIRTLVDTLGLAEAVCFPGIVSKDELLRLYQGAELFVLPSRQEGLGIVMLEAMACGTPVIATDCGGPEGIVVDGITGRIVPNDDADRFAQAVIDTLNHPDELAAMRERCREFAVEQWSREVVEDTLIQHFETSTSVRSAGRIREAVAAMWAILVTAAYVQHQLALNGDAVQRLLTSLFTSQ
jgi:glycosyltransferase involved in cell wall biosynthesis